MHEVFLSAVADYVPKQVVQIDEAVSRGCYPEDRRMQDGFTSIAVEKDLDLAQMACRVGQALTAAQNSKVDIGDLYLCSIHRHGHNVLWPPVSYVHKQLGLATSTRSVGISQGCNGAFVAASMACDLIRFGAKKDHLIIGSDRYCGSAFDRWTSDLGTIYGDAAAGIRLTPKPSKLKVQSWLVESEPLLEEMYRFAETGSEGDDDHRIKEAKKAYLEREGRNRFNFLFSEALLRLKKLLLSNTDLEENPATYIVYPNVSKGLSASLYEDCFKALATQDMWEYGRSIGHTGTCDQFIGLSHLLKTKQLETGDRVLLIGAGNGLSIASILIKVV